MRLARPTLAALLTCTLALPALAQQVWHQGIEQTSVDMRGAPAVLASRTIDVPGPGRVLLQFDGTCIASPGDRILLAASDTPSWGVNDGHVSMEPLDADVNRVSFSHSRVYAVGAGSHTFYAVGENYVEQDGTGRASVYGSFTVKYYPVAGGAAIAHGGVAASSVNLRGAPVTLGQETIAVDEPGTVLVRFDGFCIGSPGDRIVLAASDDENWNAGAGYVSGEALDADRNRWPFCHSRGYAVEAGTHTFYALGENQFETAGTGIASVYGSLTVEFVPDNGAATLDHESILEVNADVSTDLFVIDRITINPEVPGTAVARFEGNCLSDVGDRIILAVSDQQAWDVNDGHTSVEAYSQDLDRNSFSHTRAYAVGPGAHSFYAMVDQGVEDDGDGLVTVAASLSVLFFPGADITAVGDELAGLVGPGLTSYPNPFNPATTIAFELRADGPVALAVFDLRGRLVRALLDDVRAAGRHEHRWDGRDDRGEAVASGVYTVQLVADGVTSARTVVLAK
ncbi:MAG: FlgD immunoglobulin-like domain containing protein [Candidatus Krumholzibacteriia bacterium]